MNKEIDNELRLLIELTESENTTVKLDKEITTSEFIDMLKMNCSKLKLQNQELKQTKLLLEDAKTECMNMFEDAPVGYVLFNNHCEIISSNSYFEKLIGRKKSEIKGSCITKYITPESIDTFKSQLSKLEDTDSIYPCEIEILNSEDKITTQFEISVKQKAEKPFYLGAFTNITKQKQAEKQLRESEEKYKFITENNVDVLWHLDKDLYCDYISPSDYKLRGFTQEESLGKHLFTILKPEGIEMVTKTHTLRMQQHREGSANDTMHYEFEEICKDGNWVWVEAYSTAQYNDKNEIIGYNGISRDITARKTTERELENSRKELKAIYENAPVMMCLVDKNREIQFSNLKFQNYFSNTNNHNPQLPQLGSVVDCINASNSTRGCGHGAGCNDCLIRNSINETFENSLNKENKELKTYQYDENGQKKMITFLVSIAKINLNDNANLLVCLTDISSQKEIEQKLQKSEESLKKAQRISQLGSWELNLSNHEISCSEEMLRILEIGMQNSDEYYRLFSTRIHPNDKKRIAKIQQQSIEDKTTFREEYRLLFPDGRIKWVMHTSEQIYNGSGKAIKSVGVLKDITERRLTQLRMIENEDKYSRIFKNSPAAICIKDYESWQFIDVNTSFTKLFGYSPEEVIGKDSTDIELWVNDEDSKSIMERIQKGETIEAEEVKFRKKDKTEIYCLLYVLKIYINEKPSILSSVIDVSESRIYQNELRESEEKYRLIADNTSDGIIVFSADSKVIYTSPAYNRMMNAGENSSIGISPEQAFLKVHPEDREQIFNNIFEAIRLNLPSLKYSYRFYTKDRKEIWREDHTTFRYDEEGNYLGSYSLCRDITDRKQAEHALQKLNDELEQKVDERTRELENSIHVIKEAERIFRTVADYTYNWEYWQDIDKSIIYMSPSVERITGYTVEEFTSNPELIERMIVENDVKIWSKRMNKYNEMLTESENVNEYKTNIIFRIVRKDGSIKWINHSFANIYINGVNKGVRVSNRDITGMIETQNELIKVTSMVETRERNHFAQELHDGMGPLLSAIKLYFQWLTETDDTDKKGLIIEKGNKCINQAIQTARELAKGLSSAQIEKTGYVDAIIDFADSINSIGKLQIQFTFNTKIRFAKMIELNLYRITSELIKNTISYSQAEQAFVDFNYNAKLDTITLRYNDNGIGFDMHKIEVEGKGLGLMNIKQRIKSMNGDIEIETSEGNGFTAAINISNAKEDIYQFNSKLLE